MAGDERLEGYRLNAEKCLKLAQTFKDFDAKRTMLAMADAWLMLAAHRANNRNYRRRWPAALGPRQAGRSNAVLVLPARA